MGVLLSKTEQDYLLGNREFTRDQEYYIKSRLLKKIKTLYATELPLLAEKGYLAANSKNLAAFCKTPSLTDNVEVINKSSAADDAVVEIKKGGVFASARESDINIMFERVALTERGSPSLVGRGIANPMSERTRGFEMSRRRKS